MCVFCFFYWLNQIIWAEIWHIVQCEVIKHIAHNCWFESQTTLCWLVIPGKKTSFLSQRNCAEANSSKAFILFQPDPGFWSSRGNRLCELDVTPDFGRGGEPIAVRFMYKEDECQRGSFGSCEGGCFPAGTDVPLKRPLLVAITIWQPISLCSQLVD